MGGVKNVSYETNTYTAHTARPYLHTGLSCNELLILQVYHSLQAQANALVDNSLQTLFIAQKRIFFTQVFWGFPTSHFGLFPPINLTNSWAGNTVLLGQLLKGQTRLVIQAHNFLVSFYFIHSGATLTYSLPLRQVYSYLITVYNFRNFIFLLYLANILNQFTDFNYTIIFVCDILLLPYSGALCLSAPIVQVLLGYHSGLHLNFLPRE